jgi:signal peptidase I
MKAKDLDPKIQFNPPVLKKGYKYIPRGWGWTAENVNYLCYFISTDRWMCNPSYDNFSMRANGQEDVYYLEIVKDEPNTMKAKDLDPKIKCDPPVLPQGYKYIPRGWGWSAKDVIFICYSSTVDKTWDNPHLSTSSAHGYNDLYYLEIVKDEPMNTKQEKYPKLQETVEYASSLVGKFIKSRFGEKNISTSSVTGFKIHFDCAGTNNNPHKKQYFKKYGYYVTLDANWPDGVTGGYPLDPDNLNEESYDTRPKPVVIINGYTAEDKGNYFKFGCAKISKSQLKAIYHIMITDYFDDCKPLKSVTIGQGVFTKQDIQNLLDL